MKGATALRPPRSAINLPSHTQPRTPPGTEKDAQQCARCYTTPFTLPYTCTALAEVGPDARFAEDPISALPAATFFEEHSLR